MSKNALKHGYYAEDIILASERREDFDALLDEFRKECPEGISEDEIVHDLAENQWKRNRFRKAYKGALQKAGDHYIKLESSSLDWVTDDVAELAKIQMEATKALWSATSQEIQRNLNGSTASPPIPEDSLIMLKGMNLVAGALLDPLRDVAAKQQNVGVERACLTELMQKESKILAEFERRQEKALKRLYMIRELKRTSSPSSINSPNMQRKSSSIGQLENKSSKPLARELDSVAELPK